MPGDIVHDTVANDLFDVEQTASGEDVAELIEANDEVLFFKSREPADHLERPGELEVETDLFANALVTSRQQKEPPTLLLNWMLGIGLDSRFTIHREGEATVACRNCGSSLVGHHDDLAGWVCAGCGERWAETSPTERAFQLAVYGDTVTLSTPTLERSAKVGYASADGTSLSLNLDEGENIKLGMGANGRAVIDHVRGTDAVTEATSDIVVIHPDDAWSE